MKKPTMIIGKKQIILAGMTLILGLAVYIKLCSIDLRRQDKGDGRCEKSKRELRRRTARKH